MSNSSNGGGTANADWFEVTNNAAAAFDLTGFTWDDDPLSAPPGGQGNFGGITSLAGHTSLVVTGETVGDEADFRTDWNIPAGFPVINLGSTVFQNLSSTSDEV